MIGMGFFVGQMIYTIFLLLSVRSVVYQQLGDEAERLLNEEAAESPSRASGEEQEEEDDEDEEEDEDED
jgi:hypothetical protein